MEGGIHLHMGKDFKEAIGREQFRFVIQQVPTMQVTSFVVALVLSYAAYGIAPLENILAWILLITAVAVSRAVLYSRFIKERKEQPTVENRSNAYLLLALISGFVWGSSAFLILPGDNPWLTALFILVMASLSASTTVSHSSIKWAPAAWMVPAMLLYAIRCAMDGGEYKYIVAILIVVYMFTIFHYSLEHNKIVTSSIALRFENLDLLEEVRKSEAERIKTQKLEAIGILAGGIAHDFNNLLTAILGNISLAKEMVDHGKRVHRRLEEAEKASLIAKDLATRLLTFSKGGKPILKEISVEEVLRDAVQFALRGTVVRCEFRVPEGAWAAYADAGQIGQVFHNLAINAVQAMPQGGTLRASLENAHVPEGEIPHVASGNYLLIGFADQGSGIPPDVLPKVFDPYFTTKKEGSGLGLATSYNIMKSHGGNIFAESSPGAGATFRLYLPSIGKVPLEARPPREPDLPQDPAVMPESTRVLLMDDEEMVRDVAGEMLVHLGYKPVFACNGEEAIAMYAEAAGGPERFDLVILDLTIPGGMGGRETASRILKEHRGARIVVSSGYSNDPVMAHYKEHGCVGVIAKPYKLTELSYVLQQAIPSCKPTSHNA